MYTNDKFKHKFIHKRAKDLNAKPISTKIGSLMHLFSCYVNGLVQNENFSADLDCTESFLRYEKAIYIFLVGKDFKMPISRNIIV